MIMEQNAAVNKVELVSNKRNEIKKSETKDRTEDR